MTTIPLSGVALREHEDSYPASIIDPYHHQRTLRDLFRDEDGFVAVNDSPTGGGKTMSWLTPAVESGEHTVAVYPTNALITDQKESIERELKTHFPEREDGIKVLHVTSDTIRTKYAEQFPQFETNREVLEALLRVEFSNAEQVVLLTNPDILVMMYRNLYRGGFTYQSAGDIIRELNEFTTAVVDEFHRASRKEQNTLLFLLDEMYDEDDDYCAVSKLVFLSATPEERLEHRFREAMSAPYSRVTKSDQKERMAFSSPPAPDGWRSVMPPTDLDVRRASTFATGDVLLGEDWEDTKSFCAREGKTVVILDGIHEVEVVTKNLREALPNQRVERIDGFHGSEKEEKLERFDVLVSNSAVEVGIDFEVKRLVFSGHNRASFLQRLGRIRGRIDDGSTVREARCYVPDAVASDLENEVAETKGRVSREQLTAWLEDVYEDPREPETFDWRYSAAEALAHVKSQAEKYVESDETVALEQGDERVERHFSAHEEGIGLKEIKQFADTVSREVKAELQRYRGESLDVLVYDVSPDSENELKTYNPLYLLRYGDIEFFTESEFLRKVPSELRGEVESKADYVVGFCVYSGSVPMNEDGYGRSVTFKSTSDVNEWVYRESDRNNRKPKKVRLSIDVDSVSDGQGRISSLQKLRDKMEREDNKILCYALEQNSSGAKRQYKLGDFFFLYGLTTGHWDDPGCVALGNDALYLHCRVEEEASKLNFDDLGLDLGP
ncbi:type I-D CRISPR-associated helicase Cas3' [Halorussus halophilus]|uniref:type I-D CRISPR-associated helicase Cas3' n=1 Tax=Halorussus halophilus TaxID=2650975 RepID=UPI0013015C1F|nr:type I-D CRISPR-associated helicase Cas3' [Halorussus halophilus]